MIFSVHMNPMNEPSPLAGSGRALVEYATANPHSARGAVAELFPYIYEAAGRMSTRAISAFLQEEQNVALSPSTVLRALRKPDALFDGYLDEIEPALETLKDSMGEAAAMCLLVDEETFRATDANPPEPDGLTPDELGESQRALSAAFHALRNSWWVGGPRYRREALKRLKLRWAETEAGSEKAGKSTRRKK
jgi:hypothetical protein